MRGISKKEGGKIVIFVFRVIYKLLKLIREFNMVAA